MNVISSYHCSFLVFAHCSFIIIPLPHLQACVPASSNVIILLGALVKRKYVQDGDQMWKLRLILNITTLDLMGAQDLSLIHI